MVAGVSKYESPAKQARNAALAGPNDDEDDDIDLKINFNNQPKRSPEAVSVELGEFSIRKFSWQYSPLWLLCCLTFTLIRFAASFLWERGFRRDINVYKAYKVIKFKPEKREKGKRPASQQTVGDVHIYESETHFSKNGQQHIKIQ